MPALDSLYYKNASQWPAYYAIMQQELGATATLVDFCNQKQAGLINATTFTGRKFNTSGLSPVWTSSEALSAFDTSCNLMLASNYLGYAPIVTFNGTDEEADTPDNAYWTRIGATFSIGLWINPTTAAQSSTLLAKRDSTTGLEKSEWTFFLNAGVLQCYLFNAGIESIWIGRSYSVAIPANAWSFVVLTYSGGATNAACKLYRNGTQVDNANEGSGVFVNMADTTTLPTLGFNIGAAAPANFFTGKILGGPWSPFFVQVELTVEQNKNIFENMRLGLGI